MFLPFMYCECFRYEKEHKFMLSLLSNLKLLSSLLSFKAFARMAYVVLTLCRTLLLTSNQRIWFLAPIAARDSIHFLEWPV